MAKKEIAGPLAPVMQWLMPNVAFIDRSSSEKAIEGLGAGHRAPAQRRLRPGRPRGNALEDRTSSGPFKKGPFRMAMEANVPIVPIVIRNADQVANRAGAITHRGTVDVAVLAPVPVARLDGDGPRRRIDGVRQLFVDKLADW